MRYLILLFFMPAIVSAAISANTVWEIRSAGVDTNGGGFVTGASGTPYTQQDAAQYALTGVTTAGADAILLTASAATDMVGNIAQITSGTNFTAGFYEIISVVAGVSITVDRNCATAAGALGVVNIGGALKTLGRANIHAAGTVQAGNTFYVKGNWTGSTVGASDTFTVAGTVTNPVRIIGYGTTRGDGYLGRNVNGNGKLVTTNMPSYVYAATFRFICSSSTFLLIESVNFSVAGAGLANVVVGLGQNSALARCVITNPSTSTSTCVGSNTNTVIFDNDLFLSGASGGTAAVTVGSSQAKAIGNRVEMSTGDCPAITCASSASLINNTVLGAGGIGIAMTSTSGVPAIWGNTVVGCSDAINIITGTTTLQCIGMNMLTDNSAYGINMVSADNAGFLAYNRTRDNNSGAINLGTNWVAATNYGAVTTDGAAGSDYVDFGSDNLQLIFASPAVKAGKPAFGSMGAYQFEATAGGGQTSYGYSK